MGVKNKVRWSKTKLLSLSRFPNIHNSQKWFAKEESEKKEESSMTPPLNFRRFSLQIVIQILKFKNKLHDNFHIIHETQSHSRVSDNQILR